jgi:hypothetical protein
MKYLLPLLIFISISKNSYCQLKPVQERDIEIQRIDIKLEKFRKQHQVGVLLSILGAVVFIMPSVSQGKVTTATIFAGSVLSAAGYITTFDSYRHLRYELPKLDSQSPKVETTETKKT